MSRANYAQPYIGRLFADHILLYELMGKYELCYMYACVHIVIYIPLTVTVDLPSVRIALLNWDKRDAYVLKAYTYAYVLVRLCI